MSTSTIKRKQTLVDPEVQGSVLRKISIHWILFFVCNSIALMIWIRLFEQPDADWGQTFGDTLRRFLPFFVITAALIPAFVWDTLKLTNRFAGPIMRLRSALADAAPAAASNLCSSATVTSGKRSPKTSTRCSNTASFASRETSRRASPIKLTTRPKTARANQLIAGL